MKEINEKDLEKAAGGRVAREFLHRTIDCCDAFEPDYDPTLPEETAHTMRNCRHCVHRGAYYQSLIECLNNVPGDVFPTSGY